MSCSRKLSNPNGGGSWEPQLEGTETSPWGTWHYLWVDSVGTELENTQLASAAWCVGGNPTFGHRSPLLWWLLWTSEESMVSGTFFPKHMRSKGNWKRWGGGWGAVRWNLSHSTPSTNICLTLAGRRATKRQRPLSGKEVETQRGRSLLLHRLSWGLDSPPISESVLKQAWAVQQDSEMEPHFQRLWVTSACITKWEALKQEARLWLKVTK